MSCRVCVESFFGRLVDGAVGVGCDVRRWSMLVWLCTLLLLLFSCWSSRCCVVYVMSCFCSVVSVNGLMR